jgi:hypothetical protein
MQKKVPGFRANRIITCVAYVSIRQHTSAYVSIRQHTSAYVSIRQHTSVPTESSPSVKRSMRSLVLKNLRCRGSFRILFVRNCLKIWRWYIFSSIVPETSSLYTTGWYMLLHTRCYIYTLLYRGCYDIMHTLQYTGCCVITYTLLYIEAARILGTCCNIQAAVLLHTRCYI